MSRTMNKRVAQLEQAEDEPLPDWLLSWFDNNQVGPSSRQHTVDQAPSTPPSEDEMAKWAPEHRRWWKERM